MRQQFLERLASTNQTAFDCGTQRGIGNGASQRLGQRPHANGSSTVAPSTRTFLVESDPALQRHLTSVLEHQAEVSVVSHADNAMAASAWLLTNADAWDLAVVNCSLTGGSGVTVLAALRVRESRHRVVAVIENLTPETRRKCVQLGADRVFDKSSEIDELVAYCRSLSCAEKRAAMESLGS